MDHLLKPSHLQIDQELTLHLCSLDRKCTRIAISVSSSRDKTQYCETISASDFLPKEGSSILFLKLALEKCPKIVTKVDNLIWEKVLIGKQQIDEAIKNLNNNKSKKKYQGITIQIQHPERILIVLPKLRQPLNSYKNDELFHKSEKQQQAERIFFSHLHE